MRNIVLIDASPKVNEQSASEYLINLVGSHIEDANTNKAFINVRQSLRQHQTQEDFVTISKADALIIATPLYVFCLPGLLMRFLEDYYKYYQEHGLTSSNTKVYAIVNCGFPEHGINLEAVRVIRSFSQHINAHFRFGILIGGGPMLLDNAKDAPKKTMKNLNDAFTTIAHDIESNELKNIGNIEIALNFPRWLYLFLGNRSWVALARKNGLKKKELYRRPYH